MSYKPEISSLVGLWTYRSFLADPDLATAFNDLEFGRGNIKVDEAPFGIFRGRIYDTGWALDLNGSSSTALRSRSGSRARGSSVVKSGSMITSATSLPPGPTA